jgi:chemotaxis family two-component system sensor kinase Cph1
LQRRLDRANADFEEFVSIAAHNLRESLRDVTAFSQLIAETSANRLDAEAGAFLVRVQAGAANMGSLLTDIVDYAGAGSRQFSQTGMEAVLRQGLLTTEEQIRERGAIVTHDPLPAVTGDFQTLAKVLHHLIRNAIEYSETPAPRIHIGFRLVDLECVFSVQDNGPGIDPAFQSRLFGVFKRLHGKEYPGNGLGLAFCRKAIESHGGRMWMESTLGAGSTFYFALPPAD